LRNIPALSSLSNVGDYTISDGRKGTAIEVALKDGKSFLLFILVVQNAWPSVVKPHMESLQISDGVLPVLISRRISDEVKEMLVGRGFGWVDGAGNCYLSYGSFLVSINGKVSDRMSRGLLSVFERSSNVSGRILRTMLSDIHVSWRVKQLSGNARCSLGQASKVKQFLEGQGFIKSDKNGFSLANVEELLRQWAMVYNKKPQIPFECYSFEKIPVLENKIASLNNVPAYLAGISGGVRFSPSVRYDKIHVYVMPFLIQDVIDAVDLKQVDSGANVLLFPIEDEGVLIDARSMGGLRVVSPVQVFLDCMAIRGRGEEEANAVLRKEIMK
jgi:hypothetical protein